MNNFREVLCRASTLRIWGVTHRLSPDAAECSVPIFESLLDFRPSKIFVETSSKSLELSRFVWNSRANGDSPARFCEEECEHTETPAVAAAHCLTLPTGSVIPIDIDPSVTRRKLAKSALLHAYESLLLISRFHGEGLEVKSLEEVSRWRSDFRTMCPHAFDILFTDREAHMRCEILRQLHPGVERAAVVVGLSHVDALYDLLLDEVSTPS